MIEKLKKYFKGDPVIWGVIFALSIISLLAVYSSTGTLAYKYRAGNVTYYLLKHGSFLFFGFLVVYITHLIPYKYFSRIAQLVFFVSIPLLFITLAFGTSLNQASRWLTLPGTGLTFQTSDLAKIALIMYLARMLSLKQENIKSYKQGFIPLITPVVVTCALIMPANLSTAVILFTVSMILMFIGRVKTIYLFAVSAIAVLAVVTLIVIALNSDWEGRWGTWRNRVVNFMEQEDGANYQSEQSKIAIARGKVFGKGPGNSIQRNFLPHPYSDFIFAIIVEEGGLIFGLLVIFLYLYLLYRAGAIVSKSSRTFQAFLAFGLTLVLVLQAMVNMAVAVGILPVTGQPLPMISMGGTSIIFTAAALGMILSVSRSTETVVKKKIIDEPVADEEEA